MENIINMRGLLLAIPILVFVLLAGWMMQRTKKSRKKKPGQYLQYVAEGKTAAECRGLLNNPAESDIFAYELSPAQGGGWYIHFTRHKPTQQPLDTMFLLQFEGESPAEFSLSFLREAFGMKEPVIGEALLNEFFEAKLGAKRALPTETPT